MITTNNSTSGFYERSTLNMGSLRKQAEEWQAQLSSGERLSRSSDDPVAASRLRTLARAETLSAIDKANSDRAETDLKLADTALTSFADYLMRAQEITMQAANGTLTDALRAGIGKELEEIHSNLVSLANSRDSSGNALFGGEGTGQAYVLDAAGNAIYAGTATSGELGLGEGQSVTRGLTGPEFLNFTSGGSPTDLLAVIKGLADALQGGSTDPAGAARDGLDALNAGLEKLTTSQTIIGARLNWIDITIDRRIDTSEMRAAEQIAIGEPDVAETISRLQQASVVLEASQSSFARLAGLSLFDAIK